MERIKKIELDGITFEVFGQYWETRQSWGHNGYLLIDGHEVSRERIRYYDRTWEGYRFQSAGRGAVYNYIKQLKDAALNRYREATGRVVARVRRELENIADVLDNFCREACHGVYELAYLFSNGEAGYKKVA